ncbi:MAG: nucleotidyltransferase domain-containing protein [Bacteroidales bacterium]|nr:nucleotidyltransferase domain-containing protein [Bacteroidales bacterium]
MRYAARKGKKEEILNRLDRINLQRVNTVHAIQELFISEPIERAWLFGSFARMEEKADSDIDILVDLDKTVSIGLFQFAGMINTLEDKLNKRVDMVANGTVKPFALNSINRDKILFYERPRA